MKLYEYQAKEIFLREKIPVPRGKVALNPDEVEMIANQLGGKVAVKAQVYTGGRGKAGGIKLCRSPHEAKSAALQLLGTRLKGLPVNKVLVEEAFDYQKEFYLGFTVDRRLRKNVFIFTTEGGVEVEELAKQKPQAIFTYPVKDRDILSKKIDDLDCGLDDENRANLKEIIIQLYTIHKTYDCELVEINPLVLTLDNRLVALDAKLVVDDNALFRQKDLAKEEISDVEPIEREARRRGIAYVRLEGNIGIIGNGAGLVMATMDIVRKVGGAPANFLDIGGGAKAELMRSSLELILMDENIKGIFINIFGGITRCDEVAKGIISVFSEKDIKVPTVIRLAGTRCQQARELLKDTHLIFVEAMEEGARKIVELTKGA